MGKRENKEKYGTGRKTIKMEEERMKKEQVKGRIRKVNYGKRENKEKQGTGRKTIKREEKNEKRVSESQNKESKIWEKERMGKSK